MCACVLPLQCLPATPKNEPTKGDNTADTTGNEVQPKVEQKPQPVPTTTPAPAAPVQPTPAPVKPAPAPVKTNPTQVKNDLTCSACGERPKVAAQALSQAIASSGGDCNSPAGQALAQAYAAASASGMGAAFAQSIASAQATSAQKVSLDGHESCPDFKRTVLVWRQSAGSDRPSGFSEVDKILHHDHS